MISCAEGLSADDQVVLLADLEGLAAELSDVFIAAEVLDIGGLMNQGDIMLEIGFENQDAYEAAKATDAWVALKDLLLDAARVDHYEFAAYGDDGLLHLTDTTESKAHRLLFTHVRDGADPQMLEHAYQMMPFMQDPSRASTTPRSRKSWRARAPRAGTTSLNATTPTPSRLA